MAELTTTSYAILGLLNIRPWSAYELTQQAQRSLRYVWPKSESHLYAEPKRLVRMGFARVTETPAGPVRTRQVYRITAAGRRALKRWLESEPAPPQLEFEAALRLFYADATNKDAVLSALCTHRKSSNSATPRECCSRMRGSAAKHRSPSDSTSVHSSRRSPGTCSSS